MYGFQYEQEKLKIDDVLGVWPLHGIIRFMGSHCCRNIRHEALGGMGGVPFVSHLLGSLAAIVLAVLSGVLVYGTLAKTIGIRLSDSEDDISVRNIGAYPEDHIR